MDSTSSCPPRRPSEALPASNARPKLQSGPQGKLPSDSVPDLSSLKPGPLLQPCGPERKQEQRATGRDPDNAESSRCPHTRAHTHTHVYTHARTHTCTHAHTHTRTHTHTRSRTTVPTHSHTSPSAHPTSPSTPTPSPLAPALLSGELR